MEIKTLQGVDHRVLLNVFNEAFSNYFIPFKLSQEQLRTKMLVDKTDFKISVGAFDNGYLVGFILHGRDTINHQQVVYNGGTGVLEGYRGAGLTKQMYRFILPKLEKAGIHKLFLEVIEENIQAIKSYKSSGFTIKRELLCFKGEAKLQKANTRVSIKELEDFDWELMSSFWDVHPTWQYSKSAIHSLQDSCISLGAYQAHQLVAYLVYNRTNQRILQIAVHKDWRRKGLASALVKELIATNGNTLSVINLDSSSKSTQAFLEKAGLKIILKQYEMELMLGD